MRRVRILVDGDVRQDVASIIALIPGARELKRHWFKTLFRELCKELQRRSGSIPVARVTDNGIYVWEYVPRWVWVTYRVEIRKRFFVATTTVTILGLSPFDPISE